MLADVAFVLPTTLAAATAKTSSNASSPLVATTTSSMCATTLVAVAPGLCRLGMAAKLPRSASSGLVRHRLEERAELRVARAGVVAPELDELARELAVEEEIREEVGLVACLALRRGVA